ncbi:MAG: Hsp70 family protein [Phycisphaerae bacterium]|nr:Hsp70 family protein [Phycisphaerae bacterium]
MSTNDKIYDGPIIGIDLGTTNSVVAVMEGANPKVLENCHGLRMTPSIVAFTDKNERLVGNDAKNQQVMNPHDTIYSIKRFMGRYPIEVSSEEKNMPYRIVDLSGAVKVDIKDNEYTPPEISAMILLDLKKTAEDYLGKKVVRAFITIPSYFNYAQRQATIDAGKIAGLEVERIVNESTAAALAYGYGKKKNEYIAVIHFGGGTFDISILEIMPKNFAVLSTRGDTRLGGDDIDELIINHLIEKLKNDEKIDLRQDAVALVRLKEAVEIAKCELSTVEETVIRLPYITTDHSGSKHLEFIINRYFTDRLIDGVIKEIEIICRKALLDASIDAKDIGEVILVGGSTRIPKIQELVNNMFGKAPNKSINPDEAVAIGAAIQGGILFGSLKDTCLLDVTPFSLGIEVMGGAYGFNNQKKFTYSDCSI